MDKVGEGEEMVVGWGFEDAVGVAVDEGREGEGEVVGEAVVDDIVLYFHVGTAHPRTKKEVFTKTACLFLLLGCSESCCG